MKVVEYQTELQKLRNKWKIADPVGKKIIERQAMIIKRKMDEYKNQSELFQYGLDLFT